MKEKKLAEMIKNKFFLIPFAAVCAVALILTITLFSRYVFDCYNAENSVEVKNSNTVGFEVNYNNNAPEMIIGSTIIHKYIDNIVATNICSADFSKAAVFEKVPPTATITYVIKSKGNGDFFSETKALALKYEVSSGDDYVSFILLGSNAYVLEREDLDAYRERFNKVAADNKGVSFTGELIIKFEFIVRVNGGVSSTERGIVIPFSSDSYKIDYTGAAVSVKNIPERAIQNPGLLQIVSITLLCALLFVGIIGALRELLKEKDDYKRAVNGILRRFADEIVMAEDGAGLPDNPVTGVKSFKELIKFSQMMSKPVVCLEAEAVTTFYIACDGTLYTFSVERKEAAQQISPQNS